MMTRLILPFLVAFLVALAGGSALVLVRAKDAHGEALAKVATMREEAAKKEKDAAAAEPAPAPVVEEPAPEPIVAAVPLPAPGKPGATGAPVNAAAPAKVEPEKGIRTPDGTPAKSADEAAEAVSAERKLAKIFSSMPPRDAARVLQQMEDGDVRVILGHLGPRQAAAVLGNFPPERAAALSRQQMRSGGTKGTP